jgi:hypothetical protein
VVPDNFTDYFAAAGTAAGALIGLLFVAASLRPETVLGKGAPAAARAVVGSAFTALVNSFFVSLIALISLTSLGDVATVMALVSLYSTWRLHRELEIPETATLQLILAIAAYLAQLVVGIALAIKPHDHGFVYDVAYLLVASFAVALRRAWSLMQGKQVAPEHESQLSPEHGSHPHE